jgi:phthiocerol/phenolphthiocerol synthesis type-I polyketide synthase E
MRTAVSRTIKRFGALHGVLHAAGVLHGASILVPLREVGREGSEEQFRPKIHGTRVLEKVLRGRPLDFCLLFSSNAAVLGGLGFTAYAAGNLFLDSFAAEHNRRSPIPWISVNWDGWPYGDASRASGSPKTSLDLYAMTRAEAIEAFERAVQWGRGQVVVSTGDLTARLARWIAREDLAAQARSDLSGKKPELHPRPHLATDYVAPRDALEQSLAAIWQELLGIAQIGVNDNFFELDGHSLLATQIISRVREVCQVELPIKAIFEAPTIGGLAEAVRRNIAPSPPPLINNPPDSDQELLTRLDQLSDDEVDRLLTKMLKGEEPDL